LLLLDHEQIIVASRILSQRIGGRDASRIADEPDLRKLDTGAYLHGAHTLGLTQYSMGSRFRTAGQRHQSARGMDSGRGSMRRAVRHDACTWLTAHLRALFGTLAIGVGTAVLAETDNFDSAEAGVPPSDWVCGVTGGGAPQWRIEPESSAPSKPNVLKQSGRGAFPWCVKKNASLAEGVVEVKFKALDGREDQAGGLVWRWKDGNNYYVARANALEDNVSLYYTENGNRITLKYVDAPVARNQWHTLRVEFSGTRIKVALDAKSYIELDDAHLSGPGRAGVWTKADSVTAFDDFSFGSK
jgi:hypothetical protein